MLGEDGAPFFDYTRPVAFYITEKVWVNNHIHVLKAHKNVNSIFMVHYLNSVDYKYYINGSVLNKLTQGNMNQISFLCPPLPEQNRIANFLNRKCAEIDTILDKIRSSIEEYKRLKQTIITQAVTKGIRGDRPMKDSGIEWIGIIPANYKIYRLKHILKSALMYGANESGVPFDESLPRYIRITDITTDGKLKETGKLSLPEEIAKEYILENNDILFARSGASVGKTFIYKKPYGRSAFAGYLIKASTNNEIEADYLFLYTQSSIYEEWKNQIFIQATIQNIGADRYNNLPIVLPSIEEQKELITHLTDKCAEIDSIIDQKTTLLSELEAYKKSIIYEYVTGKKEVPDKYEPVL